MEAQRNSPFDPQEGRDKSRWSRRAMLRGLGGAGIILALPILQACTAAPATPTEAPPTAPPRPTDVLPSPTPQPAAQPTATPNAAAAAAPTTAPTVAPTTAPTVTPAAASTTAAQLPAQNLVFTMWDTKPEVEVVQGILDDFMKKQPNVKVTIQQFTGAERTTKYKLLATSGTPPNISIGCCGEVATFGELGLLLNLDPLVSRDNFDKSAIFAGSLSEGVFDPKTKYIGQGNLLALPFNFVFTLCWYNKNMLKKANVDEPKYDWTWDDLVATAQKLTIDKNKKTPLDAGFDQNNVVQWGLGGAQWSEWDFVLGTGGDYVTPENKVVIDSPENVKAITFVRDLIHKYKVLPIPSSIKNIAIFPTGTAVAITKDGSWNYRFWVGEIKSLFEWDVVPVPIGPIGKRVGYGGSNQFWSWNGVKNQDGSWEVMKHLVDPTMQLQWSGRWGIPAVKSAALNPDFSGVAQFTPRMAKMSAEAGAYIKSSDPTIRSDEWKPIMTAELGPVWEGTKSPADALKSAQDKVAAVMSRPA